MVIGIIILASVSILAWQIRELRRATTAQKLQFKEIAAHWKKPALDTDTRVLELPLAQVHPLLREQELAWIEKHRTKLEEKYPGQWIVVEGEQLVAASNDPAKAAQQAENRGVQIPFLYRVPSSEDLPFIGLSAMRSLSLPVSLSFSFVQSYERQRIPGGFTHRPMVMVRVFAGKVRDVPMLLDSGADYCMFPMLWAPVLGIDLSQVPPESVLGVGGQARTYFHDVDFEFLGQRVSGARVGFVEGYTWLPLLGRDPLFNRFQFAFRQSRLEFYAADHP